MKFGQSIEYNMWKFSFKTPAQNEAERPVPDIFLFFKKAL